MGVVLLNALEDTQQRAGPPGVGFDCAIHKSLFPAGTTGCGSMVATGFLPPL